MSTHTIPPTIPHTHTIIFLHGRGSSALTFSSEIFESQDTSDTFFPSLFPSIKWVFPSAKKRWAAVDQEEIHQWFDMASVQRPWEDEEGQIKGLKESVEQISEVVKKEAEEVGVENVILAGISQGCAMGIFVLLMSGGRLGGFFGLCGWLPLVGDVERKMKEGGGERKMLDMPVLLQHCVDDDVVPVKNGEFLKNYLGEMDVDVRWECFEEGGHWLNEPEGMDGVVRFIREIMFRGDYKAA